MTNARMVRVGLVQQQVGSDVHSNLARTIAAIGEAARQGAQVVCLQELFSWYYFCQREDHEFFKLAEAIPGPTTEALCAVARDLGVVIVASLFEKRAEGLYHNTAAIIDADGQYLGKYRKMHIPDDPQFYEKFYFAPGDLGFRVWNTQFGRLGVLICWDQWYPEAARLTALHGAEILIYPTAIGWLPAEKDEFGERQRSAWETMQRSHAVANGCFVCAVNRCGHEILPGSKAGEKGIEFWGHSFVADPGGRILVQAGAEETVLVADCDLAEVDTARTHWPFLRDRRIDAYDGLTKRFLD
jgi:N-carbamoylputrescine amidase